MVSCSYTVMFSMRLLGFICQTKNARLYYPFIPLFRCAFLLRHYHLLKNRSSTLAISHSISSRPLTPHFPPFGPHIASSSIPHGLHSPRTRCHDCTPLHRWKHHFLTRQRKQQSRWVLSTNSFDKPFPPSRLPSKTLSCHHPHTLAQHLFFQKQHTPTSSPPARRSRARPTATRSTGGW